MRKWKVAGIVVSILFVLFLTVTLWIHGVAAKRFARMEVQVIALHEETRARDSSRPPRGTPIPGNAWEDYENAFVELDADKLAMRAVDAFVGRDPKADRAKAEAVLAAHATALDLLRRGARRERGEYSSDWQRGAAIKVPGLLVSQRLANLAAARARILAEYGMAREATELLLDTCQFARDEGANTPLICGMIALALYGIAFDELRDIVRSGRLSREELLELGRSLEGIDRSFPKHGDSLMNESLSMGYQFLQSGGAQALEFQMERDPAAAAQLWRYGFSDRIVAADAFDFSISAMRRMAAGCEKPWAEATALANALDKDVATTPNPIVRIMVPGLVGADRAARERRAQLRLLRAAVRWRATGEMPDLEDPFGAKLLHSTQGDTLKVWSVGKNGVDDGGTGEWKPHLGKDIVLEIGR